MSSQRESCEVFMDESGSVNAFVCRGLGLREDTFPDGLALGFRLSGKLIGGLIYHDLRSNADLWWTIYTIDKRWCTRSVLNLIFDIAFDFYNVRRLSLLIDVDNKPCLKLVEKLGFKREGLLRAYRDDAKDCYIYGMLKSENKWKGKKYE